jgi:hypothetical protein
MAAFIKFTEIHDTGKTKVFNVHPIQSTDLLGKICWYPNWRRYVFFPSQMTLFDSKCLADISNLIVQLMTDRKLSKLKSGEL